MKITIMIIVGFCLLTSFVCAGWLPATQAQSQSLKSFHRQTQQQQPPVQKSSTQLRNKQFESYRGDKFKV
jgi:hypothetical protein